MNHFNKVQKVLGYNFKNVDLLQQAFVRKSYSQQYGGQDNEVLEFIGDKALDFAVIKIMMEEFGEITTDKDYKEFKLGNPKYFKTKYNEGKFTELKRMLVESKALASIVDQYHFNDYLIMGKGDIVKKVDKKDSVKEALFEAIIGAISIDCEYDINAIEGVLKNLIDFEYFFDNVDDDNYVGKVQEWTLQNGYGYPSYSYQQDESSKEFKCVGSIKNLVNKEGYGPSKAKARMNAAHKLFKFLEENDYFYNEYFEAVGNPDPDLCLRQINELIQKGLIDNVNYMFENDSDSLLGQNWNCVLLCANEKYLGIGSTKKEAQKDAAFCFLCDIICGDDSEDDDDDLPF